jgi:hypothetical protein
LADRAEFSAGHRGLIALHVAQLHIGNHCWLDGDDEAKLLSWARSPEWFPRGSNEIIKSVRISLPQSHFIALAFSMGGKCLVVF